MPQLDIDLLDDFRYIAFLSLIFGLGDGETEENVITSNLYKCLGEYYRIELNNIRITSNIIDKLTLTHL